MGRRQTSRVLRGSRALGIRVLSVGKEMEIQGKDGDNSGASWGGQLCTGQCETSTVEDIPPWPSQVPVPCLSLF